MDSLTDAEALAMMTYEQREAHYCRFPPDSHSPFAQDSWMGRYDTRHDMTPDGRNLDYWQRAIISPQMQKIADERANKERK